MIIEPVLTKHLSIADSKTIWFRQVSPNYSVNQFMLLFTDGVNHIVHWKLSKSELDLFFKHNISYDRNTAEYVINQPGYYYIYSQITMNIEEDDQIGRDSICHYIYRTRKGIPDKLLQNSRTRCKFQGDESKSTSYIGAVFNLNKDDRLMVKVSHPNVVDKAESSSYYGLHII